jgi:hypothetical protein
MRRQATVGGIPTSRWDAVQETMDASDEHPRILAAHSARGETARRSLRDFLIVPMRKGCGKVWMRAFMFRLRIELELRARARASEDGHDYIAKPVVSKN